jgi:hypothetical protein
MTISRINLMELFMLKFKQVSPAIGALIATVTALVAVMAAEARGEEAMQPAAARPDAAAGSVVIDNAPVFARLAEAISSDGVE